MNTSQYTKAYLANLKLEISNNNKNLTANKNNPSLNQYVQTGGHVVGASTLLWKGNQTNTQSKGTKK
jgi:DNA polymerase III sliding clamp (beta) subunit (PCNA family)